MLHITNGDSAAHVLQRTGLAGEILAWRDILHEGPTPAGLTLEEMSEVRAKFLAQKGWATLAEAQENFQRRDHTLSQFKTHEEIILWFEHDLYDQLQIIQILDWFAQQDLTESKLSLICINTFPSVADFHGLGQLDETQLSSLYPGRQAIGTQQLQLAREAWTAYCEPDPLSLTALIQQDTSALPFLKDALQRHLAQFPERANGLASTEQSILDVIANGHTSPIDIFLASQQKEAVPFMGDMPLWHYMEGLSIARYPLLMRQDGQAFHAPSSQQPPDEHFKQQHIVLTTIGQEVRQGQKDWIALQNHIDYWCGGVHFTGSEAQWRWDSLQQTVVQLI